MADGQKVGSALSTREIAALDIEVVREHICKMSDPELLRFGVTTNFRYSKQLLPDGISSENLAEQLQEARLEWVRRFPNLPLREAF